MAGQPKEHNQVPTTALSTLSTDVLWAIAMCSSPTPVDNGDAEALTDVGVGLCHQLRSVF